MNDSEQVTKVKRKIKIYMTLSFLSGLCFFVTAYFFNLYESRVVDGMEWFTTMLYLTPLTIVGWVLSVVGFVTFGTLSFTTSKELAKISPQDISPVKVKKLKKHTHLAVKILLVAIVVLIIVTILNDPSILSEDNLK